MNSSAIPQSKRRVDPVLAAIVFLGAIVGALAVSRARNWAAMTDELLYTGMARSIAHSVIPLPQIHGESFHANQVLFPTVIAPLVGSMTMTTAYPLIAALNAVIFATAAIPAYMLTNLVTENRTAARWVAVCTIVTPWLTLTSKAFPDPLAYVAVLWTAYALVRTAGRHPRQLRGDLLTLLAIVLAYLVRNQFLLLLGVWVGAVVLCRVGETLGEKSWRDLPRELITLLRERPLPFVVFVLVILSIKIQPDWLLGIYTITTSSEGGGAAPSGIFNAFFNHASVVALGIAGLPVVLGFPWIVAALGRVKDRVQFDTAVVIVLMSVAIIYVGASFDQRFTELDRVIERYVFYFAPLMLVAMAAFFTKPPKTLIGFALPALAGVYLLNAAHPYGSDQRLGLILYHAFSPAQVAFTAYQHVADKLGTSIFGVFLVASVVVAALVCWLLESGRRMLALNGTFALLFTVLLATTIYTVPKIVNVQNSLATELFGPRSSADKHWLDTATGGEPTSLVFTRRLDVVSRKKFKPVESIGHWWDLDFWNGSISRFYSPPDGQPIAYTPTPGHSNYMRVDWESGALARVKGDDAEYIVQSATNPNFAPHSEVTPLVHKGFALYKTGPDATAAWATRGLTGSGWVPPSGATLRIYLTPVRVRLLMASPKSGGLKGFKVEGARDLTSKQLGRRTEYSWTVDSLNGKPVDFKLVKGEGPSHLDSVTTEPLPG
jgi:hypothetical protein